MKQMTISLLNKAKLAENIANRDLRKTISFGSDHDILGKSLEKMAKTGTLLATRVISQYGARIADETWSTIHTEVKL